MKKTYNKHSIHQFSFYVDNLTSLVASLFVGKTLYISDDNLLHRVSNVVRLNSGDICTIFDNETNIRFKIISIDKKRHLTGVILEKNKNRILLPHITFLLPLLKKEHFEAALYSLAELGANVIQPIIVRKTQRKWGGEKEFIRSEKILISAAEQSKNFVFPNLLEPVDLQESDYLCKGKGLQKIFFDQSGDCFTNVAKKLHEKNLVLMIGPEGDLTSEEKNYLLKKDFLFCVLTPSTLRSLQAAALSVGMIRSIFNCGN